MTDNVVSLSGDQPRLDMQREFAAFTAEQVELFQTDSGGLPDAVVVVTMNREGAFRTSHYVPDSSIAKRYLYALAAAGLAERAIS